MDPAYSSFVVAGLLGRNAQPIDEANGPTARQLQRRCFTTLRWLILFSLGLMRFVTAIYLFSDQSLRFGFAWVFLAVTLALHVLDEALTDFLAVYNPAVQAIRKRFPFIPLPTFTFRVWLTHLCVGIALTFFLSFLAFNHSHVPVVLAYPVAFILFANGVGHIGVSIYRRRIISGLYSSPLLVAASAYLFYCATNIQN